MRTIIKNMIIILITASILLTFFGCKKNIEEEPIDTDSVNDSSDTMVDTEINEPITDDLEQPDESLESVPDDVYDNDDGLAIVEHIDISLVENTIDLTDEVLSSIRKMVYYAYFNYLWTPNSIDGVITKEEMQKFAISYIYQYEYNELFFDTNSFELHIPDQMVTEIVRIFFDESFVNHVIEHDFVKHEIGFYHMSAVDGGVIYDPVIVEIIKTSDFSYQVIYESSEAAVSIEEPKVQYRIDIEEREGRYIYTAFTLLVTRD